MPIKNDLSPEIDSFAGVARASKAQRGILLRTYTCSRSMCVWVCTYMGRQVALSAQSSNSERVTQLIFLTAQLVKWTFSKFRLPDGEGVTRSQEIKILSIYSTTAGLKKVYG